MELVWYVDPRARVVRAYTSYDNCVTLTEDDELDGAGVLPGFRLSIREWFERAEKVRR